MANVKAHPLTICGITIQPGEKLTLALPTPQLYACAPLHIPMHIIHGKTKGPTLLICATLYGDELNGIDIVHRLLNLNLIKKISGTLICIPVMNIYGLMNHSRHLPDGRDLADSFPGTEKGSFAARLAHLFSTEIIEHITHCINIRCGTGPTYKLPQVYYHPEDPVATQLAKVFGVPVIKPSNEKTGFFYSEAGTPKRPTLIFEAGEAHRTDEFSSKIGVRGIVRVLKDLKMIRTDKKGKDIATVTAQDTTWVRASGSGLFHFRKKVGQFVTCGEKVGVIDDPFGTNIPFDVIAPIEGIITAITTYPHVYEGQGIVEICVPKEGNQPLAELDTHPSDVVIAP